MGLEVVRGSRKGKDVRLRHIVVTISYPGRQSVGSKPRTQVEYNHRNLLLDVAKKVDILFKTDNS